MKGENKEASQALQAAAAQAKADNYVNALSGFGGANDPMRRVAHRANDPNTHAVNELMYESEWITRRIIEAIPEDATREWIEFSVKDDDNAQEIEQAVNTKMEELELRSNTEEAFILSRLYGGSIMVITTDGGGEPEEPLKEDQINKITSLNILDRWQVDILSTFDDPLLPNFGEPEFYRLTPISERGATAITTSKIHASRTVKFDGDFLPKRRKVSNSGWHLSIIEAMNEALKFHGVSLQSGSVLLQDFITKVLKIPDLASILSNQETAAKTLEARIQFALSTMSSVGISLIGQDEELTKLATPGVRELVKLIETFIDNVAAASGIPKSRLFNQQLGQLAGAEETTRAYFDMVRGIQNKKLRKQLHRIISLIIKSKEIKGDPKTWGFTFNSLWQPTELQKSETMQRTAIADKAWIESSVLDPDEVAESRFTEDGFSLETRLDMEARKQPTPTERGDQEEAHVHEVDGKFTGPPIQSPEGGHRHMFNGELTSLGQPKGEGQHNHALFDSRETGPAITREEVNS